MSQVSAPFFFDRATLKARALERRAEYAAAAPYPHASFDGFVGDAHARAIAQAFPGPAHEGWVRREYQEQARLGQLQRRGFEGVAPIVRHFLAELNGMAFLDFLGVLTGVSGLIPDPHFVGAGLSLTGRGGHLAVHVDFNRDRTRHLERAVTVLYYLGEDWEPEWGGALELWDAPAERAVASYLPVLDRLVVMAHGDTFWHGHPAPLACPPHRFRAVISAYFYVASPSSAGGYDDSNAHGAIWANTPNAKS